MNWFHVALIIAVVLLFFVILPLLFLATDKLRDRAKKRCYEWVVARGGQVVAIEESYHALTRSYSYEVKWTDADGNMQGVTYHADPINPRFKPHPTPNQDKPVSKDDDSSSSESTPRQGGEK